MLASFILKCRIDTESLIDLPPSGYFVKNENSIRLSYLYHGELKYINLASRQEVAEFLKKHGIIKMFSLRNRQVTMYQKSYYYLIGQHKMKEGIAPYTWEQIEFTPGQVITFAAEKEVAKNPFINKFVLHHFKRA